MEVRRSRHGKAALVISGNSIVKYLTIAGNCPVFGSMYYVDFRKEFNAVVDMTIDKALLSFLKASKNALKHNQEVISFIMEKLMSDIEKNLADMTYEQILLRYNNICVAANKKPRKSFDSKKAVLAAIEALDAEIQVPTETQVEAVNKSTSRRSSMTEGTVVEKKPRGKGIGAMAKELLLAGKSTTEVIEQIKAEIEGANPTPATIAWYKNKLRQDGLLAKPVKKEKTAKAVAENDEQEAEAA